MYKHGIRNTVIRNTEPAPKPPGPGTGLLDTYNKNKKKTQPLIIAQKCLAMSSVPVLLARIQRTTKGTLATWLAK